MKLTQQRAQLERHRKEVSELKRETAVLKDEVVEANQMAKTFEKGEDIYILGESYLLLRLISLYIHFVPFLRVSKEEANAQCQCTCLIQQQF